MSSKIYRRLYYFLEIRDKVLKHYDPGKVYNYNFWIYVISGFWKYESPKQWKTRMYRAYQKLIKLVYAVSFMFFVIDAVIVRNELEKLSFNMSSSVLVLTKILQIMLLSSQKDVFEEINEKLENHLHVDSVGGSEEDKTILRQKAEIILKISCMFYGLLLTGFPLRVMADTAFGSRAFLIPMPFREVLEEYYEYVYAQQVIVSFHFMMTTLAYDLIGFSFIIRLIAHYEILGKNFHKIKVLYPRRNFEKYVKGYVENQELVAPSRDVLIRKTNYLDKMETFFKNYKLDRYNVMQWSESEQWREEKTFQLLKESINHHQKLLAVVRNFFGVYSQPMLIQLSGMVILVGIAALQILFLSKGLNLLLMQQVLYACTTTFNIYCLCSFGSELTSKSISATFALYDTPWYDMSISNRNVVNLILEKLMQAPVFKGGGMIKIDRVSCVKFFQTSYNMVALLRNKI